MTLTITLTPSLPLALSLTSSMAKSPKPSAVPVGAEADAWSGEMWRRCRGGVGGGRGDLGEIQGRYRGDTGEM